MWQDDSGTANRMAAILGGGEGLVTAWSTSARIWGRECDRVRWVGERGAER